MFKSWGKDSKEMKKILLPSVVVIFLIACSPDTDEIYLSCNGFSDTINVYGNNVEEKREQLIIPVKIKKLESSFGGLFNPPEYQIVVGYKVFNNPQLFVDKNEYVGTHKRTADSDQIQTESRFNINRNTNHLIYFDFSFSPKTKEREKTQKTIDFEGRCEKIQGKI
jgi:hypothetical protein